MPKKHSVLPVLKAVFQLTELQIFLLHRGCYVFDPGFVFMLLFFFVDSERQDILATIILLIHANECKFKRKFSGL
jgi:hypothetical protein